MDHVERSTLYQRHAARVQHKLFSHVAGHGPANDAAAPGVDHDRQEEESLLRRDVGDVSSVELIGTVSLEFAIHEIRRPLTGFTDRRAGALAAAHALQTGRTYEASHGFRSLQESIDTTTSGGKLIFQIFGALAEFEHNLIRERTQAGLAAARARGRKGGRPRKLTPRKEDLLYRLYDSQEHTIAEICTMVGISRSGLYEYLNRRKAAAPENESA